MGLCRGCSTIINWNKYRIGYEPDKRQPYSGMPKLSTLNISALIFGFFQKIGYIVSPYLFFQVSLFQSVVHGPEKNLKKLSETVCFFGKGP